MARLHELAPEDLKCIQWNNYVNSIVFIQNDTLYEVEYSTKIKKVLLTLSVLKTKISGEPDTELVSFPQFTFYDKDRLLFQSDNIVYSYDISESKLIKLFILPDGSDNLTYDHSYSNVAFTVDSNVFVLDRFGKQTQVTFDTLNGISNGQVVYRNEFGTEEGIFWSPKGNYIAFYHMNEIEVSEYPLVRIDTRISTVENTRYPMAGMKSENTEVWVFSISDKRIFRLKIESPPDDYHTNISWTRDESAIYIQHLNRAQDTMILRSYAIPEGNFQQEFFIEQDDQYVEPLYPLVFSKLHPGDFFYQSARNGYNHIYWYKSSDNSLIQLTKGFWEVTEFLGCDKNENNLFFIATKENPLERHLYKYNFKRNSVERLTSGEGTHSIKMNSDGTEFIDILSGFSTPNRISVIDSDGETKSILLDAPDPLTEYKLGEVEIGELTAADDSTDIYFRLVKPVDFDSTKQYPVVVYVYGGPHLQLITNSWMGRIDFLQQYFAQNGYVSFTIDPRGSRNRGTEFEQVIHRQSGIPQLEDHINGINYLKSLNYIDTTRIGVHGWSYGGYMTILMMLTHPDIFKVGVSGGPVIDWKYYEVMYGERYMDTPEENPEGYELTNLRNYTDSLKGNLLVIHGALDPTVVWQHSLTFIQSCIKSGVYPDYFVYPLHKHNVIGRDRVHLTRMITEYFFEHL